MMILLSFKSACLFYSRFNKHWTLNHENFLAVFSVYLSHCSHVYHITCSCLALADYNAIFTTSQTFTTVLIDRLGMRSKYTKTKRLNKMIFFDCCNAVTIEIHPYRHTRRPQTDKHE